MVGSIKKRVIAAVLCLGLAFGGAAAQAADPIKVRFAAAPTGSTWYAYAGALRSAMLEGLPPGSSVDILTTPMAIANTKLLGAQRAEIGLIFPPVAAWAAQGFGPFESKIDNVRGLIGGMDQYYQRITVQKDSPIRSIAEIKEKKIPVRLGTGPQGSLNEYIARLILAANDLTYEEIESYGGSVAKAGFEVLRDQFADKRLDMIIGITTAGHPNTAQLSIAPGQRFLGLSDKAIEYLVQHGFAPATMPPGMFEGQDEPVHGVGFTTSLYASTAVSEEDAHAITKAIMERRENIKRAFGSMEGWTAAGSLEPGNLAVPLHPGAEKYYKEAGLLK
jgi:hypothetical protein